MASSNNRLSRPIALHRKTKCSIKGFRCMVERNERSISAVAVKKKTVSQKGVVYRPAGRVWI